jgi:hypothetical protein
LPLDEVFQRIAFLIYDSMPTYYLCKMYQNSLIRTVSKRLLISPCCCKCQPLFLQQWRQVAVSLHRLYPENSTYPIR